MNAMVLCPACKRHVFAGEPACPFCGLGFTSSADREAPAMPPDLSRAQRYVVGAALAASVATASCSSPTVVRNANDLGNVTVDVNEAQPDRNRQDSVVVADDPDEERQRRLEAERQRRKDFKDEENTDWRDRRWRSGGGCDGNVCPPYGCVFPDEAYDVVRV